MTQFGQVLSQQLPQTGYLGRIWLYWTGNLTTGAGTPAGSYLSYVPSPYNLIRRIRVYTNENAEIVNISGWGLFLHNLLYRDDAKPAQDATTQYNSGNRALLFAASSGAAVASTVTPVAGWLEIPIMTDDAAMLGLLMTQNLDTRINLEITTGNAGDVHAITGVTVTPTVTFYTAPEFYSVPAFAESQPNLAYAHTLLEETAPINNTGDVIYRVPPGNTYIKLFGILENNGAQVSPANINTVTFRFAQSTTPYIYTYPELMARSKAYYKQTPPDGLWVFEWSAGTGVVGVLEPRDVFNSSLQTDVQVIVNLAAFSLTNAQNRVIKEQIVEIR
jgi:hypothetical protein